MMPKEIARIVDAAASDRRLGAVLRWGEECRRLSGIQASMVDSARTRGVGLDRLTLTAWPARPLPDPLAEARSLSDDATGDLTLPDE